MTKRAIEYLEELRTNEEWEVHVRREDTNIDIITIERDIRDVDLLVVRCDGESWGRFRSLTDALNQALDPIMSEDWTAEAAKQQ